MIKKIVSIYIFLALNITYLNAYDMSVTSYDEYEQQEQIYEDSESINSYIPVSVNKDISDLSTLNELNHPTSIVFDITKNPNTFDVSSVSKIMLRVEKIAVEIDKVSGIFPREVTTFTCRKDVKNTEYCPINLLPATSFYTYSNGSSVEHTQTVRDWQNSETVFKCPYNGYLIKRLYKNTCPKCIDSYMTMEVKCFTNGNTNIHFFTSKRPNSGRVYWNIKSINKRIYADSSMPYSFVADVGNHCHFPFYYGRTCDSSGCSHKMGLRGSTCNGRDFSTSGYAKFPTTKKCNTGYKKSGNSCFKDIQYKFYSYACAEGFIVDKIGFQDFIKEDPDRSKSNENSLISSVNNVNSPVNNCKKEGFKCIDEAPPVFVDGEWKCSPFICDSNRECGIATCINGEAMDENTLFDESPLVGKNATNVCNSKLCDAARYERLGRCGTDSKCPTAFGVYEYNGKCYKNVCPPKATVKDLGADEFSCLSLQCPRGYELDNDEECVKE